MGFLEQFDGLSDEEGNKLLWEWIRNKRGELFEELRAERPILKFFSLNPGNPDTGETGGGPAYLLTKRVDVKHAMAEFSMKPYVLGGQFILSLDDPDDHGPKRARLQKAILVSPPEEPPPSSAQVDDVRKQVIETIDAAIQKSWDKYADGATSGDTIELDVRGFCRDVALRFIGLFYGIPEDKIFDGTDNLRKWSLDAYEDFIWKIHARHFIAPRPNPGAGLESLQKIGKLIVEVNAANPGQNTVIGRLFSDPGPFPTEPPAESHIPPNLIGLVQGLIDNVMTGACLALNQFFEMNEITAAHAASGDTDELIKLMHAAHRRDTPGPFLPRRGSVADLPSNSTETGDDLNFACAIGAALADPASDPDPAPDAWDIRMGWGRHLCIGRWIGDQIMARSLARIVGLNNLEIAAPLEKQWGWIVKQFAVSGKVA